VNITDLHLVLNRFRVIANYWSNYRFYRASVWCEPQTYDCEIWPQEPTEIQRSHYLCVARYETCFSILNSCVVLMFFCKCCQQTVTF